MSSIQNVVLAGASGALGSRVLEALIDSAVFKITVLARKSSEAQFPPSVQVVHVDYESIPELTAALTGQDAVVSTVGGAGTMSQIPLIEASIAAGVKRFIPSEFGADAGNPNAAKLPVYQRSIAIHKALQEQAKVHPEFSYTLIRNGMFLDWGLVRQYHFAFSSETPPFYDGGDRPFSTTTLYTVGRAVAGVLGHLEETKNRVVYVHDMIVTQRQIMGIAQKIAPEKKWNPVTVNITDLVAKSRESYAKGVFDLNSSIGFLCQAVYGEGYGGEFQKVENELFGIPLKTEADLEELVRNVMSASVPN
jgi:uncharacterized protein YbjT (DUF2867 family)